MTISNKKAKQRAKRKRKEFKNRIKSEKEAAKIRKEEKAERNRRFSGQDPQTRLPEDDYLVFDTSPLINKERDNYKSLWMLEGLYERQFFYRLQNELNKKECNNTLLVSRELLQRMGYGKVKIEQFLYLLKEYGGHCDCEVIYNIVGCCLRENYNYFSDNLY